jgi:hypothetical protein
MESQNALRDKIVSCICTMDVRMLDVLLPDHGLYERTYKEVWLGRLNSFFKKCQKMGESMLTVERSVWSDDELCDGDDDIWHFESGETGKGFAIYFIMDGDEIKGIARWYPNNGEILGLKPNHDAVDPEAFYIYDHEKIGFVDSLEYKVLRRNVKLFIEDMTNPRRHTLGLLGLKRKVVDYNQLYYDVNDVHYLFENKLKMLEVYEDLYSIKNVFNQRKGFLQVIEKCHELLQATDQKSKVRVMKWFLRHEFKVKNYIVFHSDVDVESYRMIYQYRINGVPRRLVIRHPKIEMDVDACSFLMGYVKQFYIYLFDKYLIDGSIYEYMESKCAMYHHFKDRMDEVVGEFDDRVWCTKT